MGKKDFVKVEGKVRDERPSFIMVSQTEESNSRRCDSQLIKHIETQTHETKICQNIFVNINIVILHYIIDSA